MAVRLSSKNASLYEEALELMPGSQSNAAVAVIDRPLFFVKGKGARLWDVDGKEYIEFWSGLGPGILGYGNSEYLAEVKKQLEVLPYLPSLAFMPGEIELARKIVEHIPCAEKVRFITTGTEAVQLAIRLARAYTKRRYFIRFGGHYHGWLDNVVGGKPSEDPVEHPFPLEFEGDPMGTEGRSSHALSDSFLLPWNEADVLESVLRKYGDEVALIHMEPVHCNGGCSPPRPGYLEKVRELCTRYGIVLCFDEVITGFRVGLGGAQRQFGVTPDICTLGKAMAGGTPMAAVAGKREILDLLLERRVLGAGTFNGNPVAVAAALATIKILEKDDGAVYEQIDRHQQRLQQGMRDISQRYGFPAVVQGPRGAIFWAPAEGEVLYSVREIKERVDAEFLQRHISRLTDEGILAGRQGRWYLSAGFADADIDEALERMDRATSKL